MVSLLPLGFRGDSAVKNPPNTGAPGHTGSIPESAWRGSPLQDSCLENPMDRGAWRAAVHGAAKSQTCLKQLSITSFGELVRLSLFAFPNLRFTNGGIFHWKNASL